MEKTLQAEKTAGRNIGIDLCSLVAVFMITMLHVLRGSVSETSKLYILAEGLLLCCFNLFGAVAGYALSTGKFKLAKAIRVWVMAFFYSVLFQLITAAVQKSFSGRAFFRSFFPLLTNNRYFWFFAPYLLVLFLIPVFNYAIEKLSQKGYLAALIFFAVFFSAVQFASDPWGLDDGKSALWVCYLYFVGAYFRKYGFFIRKGWINLLVYLGSAGLSAGLLVLSGKITLSIWKASYGVYFHQYNSLFALIGAVALLGLFAQLPIKEKAGRTMRYFASHAFGIYLLQSFMIQIFISLLKISGWGAVKTFFVIVVFGVAVFVGAFLVEALRKLLFRYARLDDLIDRCGGAIQGKLEDK